MPDQVRLSFLNWLATEDSDRQARYTAYREFYDGDHDTQLTTRQRKYLQVKIGDEFNSNYCPIVVDVLAERLNVTGIQVEGQDEEMWDWWQKNRMDGTQGVVHTSVLRDGDTYVLVEWNNEKQLPQFTPEPACDGIYGIKVHYAEAGLRNVAFASKRWRVEDEDPESAGKMRRLNLYYPDRIEKYYSHSEEFEGDWMPYQDEGDPWPLPWVAADGTPLGVPMIHFRNKEQGYKYGISELKNIIPLQNALNKAIIDLMATADSTGFPLLYMLGDDPSELKVAPGSWIYSLRPPTGEGSVAVGKIPSEDLTSLIAFKDAIVAEIARVSRTPLSYFQVTGQIAAEGTQKQQESGLVAKAKDRMIGFGNSWEDAFYMARRLHNTFGAGGMDEEQAISIEWDDPETRNDKEYREALQIEAALGVPEEMIWRKLGYDADEIAEMQAMKAETLAAESNIGGALLRNFESGGFAGGGLNANNTANTEPFQPVQAAAPS